MENKFITDPQQWDYARWPNFTPEEMISNGNGELKISVAALDKLQMMRDMVGKPFLINSAYRDPVYNREVGGVPNSQHVEGTAFDISLRNGLNIDVLETVAREVGFKGIGLYWSFIHVDDRSGRKATWGPRLRR